MWLHFQCTLQGKWLQCGFVLWFVVLQTEEYWFYGAIHYGICTNRKMVNLSHSYIYTVWIRFRRAHKVSNLVRIFLHIFSSFKCRNCILKHKTTFKMINTCKANPLQSILIYLKLIINTCNIKAQIKCFTSYWIFMHYSPFYSKYWLFLSWGITSQALPSTMQSQFTLLNRLELHIHWG